MPRGGRNKPNQLKLIEGNRSKVKQDRLTAEPPGLGYPREPDHLSPEELGLWRDVVRSLPLGLLTRADEGILERYAVAWARYREVGRIVAETGLMVMTRQGPIRNPLLAVQTAAAKEMHSAGAEIGLSPAARSRMSAPDASDTDPMELLLGPDGDPDGAWATPSQDK